MIPSEDLSQPNGTCEHGIILQSCSKVGLIGEGCLNLFKQLLNVYKALPVEVLLAGDSH